MAEAINQRPELTISLARETLPVYPIPAIRPWLKCTKCRSGCCAAQLALANQSKLNPATPSVNFFNFLQLGIDIQTI